MARKPATSISRFALTPAEAAASIGVGEDFFTAHVRPELRVVRRGRKVLVATTELERWLEQSAEHPLAEQVGAATPRPFKTRTCR